MSMFVGSQRTRLHHILRTWTGHHPDRRFVNASPATLCPCFIFQRMWLHHFLMHPVVRNCVQGRINDSKSR